MGVGRYDEQVEEQLREIVKRGISSFKIFLAYKGAFGIDDAELYRTLRLAKKLGVIITAHCENADLVAELQRSSWPRARPARNGTTKAVRRWSRPRASIT